MTESESVDNRGATANKKTHGRLPMLKGYLILSADPEYAKTKYTYVQIHLHFHIFKKKSP